MTFMFDSRFDVLLLKVSVSFQKGPLLSATSTECFPNSFGDHQDASGESECLFGSAVV